MTFSFSYVKVEQIEQLFLVFPTVFATSIIVGLVKSYVLIAYSRFRGVWAELKLWYFGLITFLITTIIFRVPFSSPTRSVFYGPKSSQKLSVVLSIGSIVISLVFSVLFYTLLLNGFFVIGSTGLAMCVISAFFDTFPVTPMRGKTIFDYNKIVWFCLFVFTFVLYVSWLFFL